MIFITGGTGLVGSHLVAELLERGEQLRLLRRETSDTRALERLLKRRNLEHKLQDIEWIEGELNDVATLTEAIHGVDYVCHCAALVSFDPGIKVPWSRLTFKELQP
ncbi:NAD-dependent epimerase/dehydratase family protein [bacterium SCSIO 12741]|nr:NAD-dependent epimerase/dehydratase family protein [bacterium SCSIO 12741]